MRLLFLLLASVCLFGQNVGIPKDCSATVYIGGYAIPSCTFYDGTAGSSTLLARLFRTGLLWTAGGINFNGKLSADTSLASDAIVSIVNSASNGYGMRLVAGGGGQTYYLLALSDYANNIRFAVYGDKTVYLAGKLFADLGSPGNGTYAYCSDCNVVSVAPHTCTSGGSGAWAFRNGGSWKCPY